MSNMLSDDEDDISERLATAMPTASSSALGVPGNFGTVSGTLGVHESDSSPATKPAKVAFSPLKQASSSNEASASG